MTAMAPILSFERAAMLRRLADERFDVVIIGGGITGAGVALDAASRGLRTALVEKGDFASGTSSKSSKLVHGGLRYLQQGDVRLVYEALAERQRLRHNAPHLVRILPFMIPILTKDGVVNPKMARALGSAMWGYDLTGGLRIGKLHRRIGAQEALAHLPTMPAERVASAYVYFDAHADDARLCLAVIRTAAAHGAVAVNYAAARRLHKNGQGVIDGVTVIAGDDMIDIRATVVVNAAGVWSDDVRALDEGRHPESIRPAKGIHITVPWSKVRNDIAAVIPVPHDRRSLFVVPWGDHTYIGTTDTDYEGPLDEPRCTPDDIAYVLRALNAAITTNVKPGDIVGTWAGLRPLVRQAGGRTADLSRRHRVTTSPGRLVSVTGGKLTTYRKMAGDTVDDVMQLLGRRGRGHTARLRLLGAEGYAEPSTGADMALELASRYGGEMTAVEALLDEDRALAGPLVPGLPYLAAEAVYAARHEMAQTLDDVLSRRTRARLLARDASAAAAPRVARLLAAELGWSASERDRQVRTYVEEVAAERDAAGLSVVVDPALGS
jgi:glycerol-3-phosphate dehydrogenase